MKLVLTNAEARALIQYFYNLNPTSTCVVDSVEIGDFVKSSGHLELLEKVRACLKADNTNRIACIKELRTLIPGLGLADAKYLLERSNHTALAYFAEKGTLIGYADAYPWRGSY